MTDATHFSARESHVPSGESPTTIDGEILSDTSLVATLEDGQTQKKTRLASNGDVFDGAGASFKEEYSGSLGGRFIRMKLEKSGNQVSGIYRYAKSAQDIELAGTADDKTGAFSMIESVAGKATGKFEGVLVSKSTILGQWTSPDGAHGFPVKLQEAEGYPNTTDLGNGLTLYPQETLVEGERCKTDIVFPQVRGAKDRAKQTILNTLLRGQKEKASFCESPDGGERPILDYEESQGYVLLTNKPGRFTSISLGQYSYMGGAHGSGVNRCLVIDSNTVSGISLSSWLTDAGRKTLSDKTTQALEKSYGVTKLTDAFFREDRIEVAPTTNVCLSDTEISVSFNLYEVAGFAAGPPRAAFPKADVRDLFQKNEATDAMFSP